MADEIMTLKEVAEYLKVAEKTVYRLVADGKLPGFKVGGSWRFKRVDIDAWIAAQSKAVARDPGIANAVKTQSLREN